VLGSHLLGDSAAGRVPPGPAVGEDAGQVVDEVTEGLAAGATVELGLEDVDAGLREPTHVGDLGLELEALGVLGAQVDFGEGLEVDAVDGIEDPGAAWMPIGHGVCLP